MKNARVFLYGVVFSFWAHGAFSQTAQPTSLLPPGGRNAKEENEEGALFTLEMTATPEGWFSAGAAPTATPTETSSVGSKATTPLEEKASTPAFTPTPTFTMTPTFTPTPTLTSTPGIVFFRVETSASSARFAWRHTFFAERVVLHIRTPALRTQKTFFWKGKAFKKNLEAGEHTLEWDYRNEQGKKLFPGVYFAFLSIQAQGIKQEAVVRFDVP